MKRIGNLASNQTFNPQSSRPNLPVDSDEVDMAMEKFIRAKYQKRSLSAPAVRPIGRTDTGSTSSTDDRPPPVPAKNTPRLNHAIRVSPSLPSPRYERPLPPLNEDEKPTEPPTRQPHPRLYTHEEKLTRLRSMGFHNEKRNMTVLKGVNGNIDRAVEALVRLGEGGHASETIRPQMPVPDRPNGMADAQYPPTSQQASAPTVFPLDGVSTRSSSATNSWNPFERPGQEKAPQPIEASFQNLKVTHSDLFADLTDTSQIPNQQHNPFFTGASPPTPSYQLNASTQLQNQYHNVQGEQTNPFLRLSRSQNFATTQPHTVNQGIAQPYQDLQPAGTISPNPHWAQLQRNFSQPEILSRQQPNQTLHMPSTYQNSLPQSPYHTPPVASPISYSTALATDYPFPLADAQQIPYQLEHGIRQPPQPAQTYPYPNTASAFNASQQNVQQTQRYDKSSILALYNSPHFVTASSQIPASSVEPQGRPQRSASTPLPGTEDASSGIVRSGSHNPFATLAPAAKTAFGGLGHIREESREFTSYVRGGNPVQTGRHSPDAFSGLSARYR